MRNSTASLGSIVRTYRSDGLDDAALVDHEDTGQARQAGWIARAFSSMNFSILFFVSVQTSVSSSRSSSSPSIASCRQPFRRDRRLVALIGGTRNVHAWSIRTSFQVVG